jgi:transposase
MKQQQRQRYPTDLTDAQWPVVERAMPGAVNGRTGTPRRFPARELWNAIFYQAKNGGTWRALPHDFPPWAAVWQQKTGPPREARVAC